MAQYLVNNGFKDAAASLAGAVLEDGLRKIAQRSQITFHQREGLSALISKLAGASIFNHVVKRQLMVYCEIRNQADHGRFDEYDLESVKIMISGIQDFLSRFL